MSDAILVEGIQISAALGVSAAERRMRRPVSVDLEVERDLVAAGRSDRIADTIDYQRFYDVVAEIASAQEHRLVEALAERIAAAILARFEVRAVTVVVRKPKPVAGVLDFAGVRIRRERT